MNVQYIVANSEDQIYFLSANERQDLKIEQGPSIRGCLGEVNWKDNGHEVSPPSNEDSQLIHNLLPPSGGNDTYNSTAHLLGAQLQIKDGEGTGNVEQLIGMGVFHDVTLNHHLALGYGVWVDRW